METYIQELIADRIGGNQFGKSTVIYKFEKIKRAKAVAISEHPDIKIIDMGVGEPDSMADEGVVKVLSEEAAKWENRNYADNGVEEFKSAAAKYLEDVYNVKDINSDTEVNHAIGSKPALAMMAQAFINPGDVTLMTVPGYPIMGTMTKWLGGEVFNLSLVQENHFLPDLNSIPKEILKRAKLLYLNYPNNPTGAVATEEFFKEVIKFAKENDLIVVHDAAYAALTFDGNKPLSFLSVDGAKEVGVEIHSLSKAYNMTGWRIAFVAGNEKVVSAFAAVKDNNDSGQFKAIQKAGIYALEHPEITEKTAAKYSRRHNMLVEVLNKIGFHAKKPIGSFYLYVKIPKGVKEGIDFECAEDFSQFLIREKLISTVPWDDAGAFVRFSVTFLADTEEEEKKVIDEIYNRLSDVEFIF
ncbi:LL-diaminopimelate aminotransferase [Vallitalea sp.]|jgi:LL-diaminopimelate aminotransferase|uniref:LL-diaminopimelate aminotransferase n=1 Tax=Vallitalea sp. TaxID=1882829 RepID=UPI0025EAACF7|nr:LL-diaminopimelate aminotransferase [Vallitalea sp.]MCT4686520.1 LL-diaminopimelate aminotransferase [Vallitalea sp.]